MPHLSKRAIGMFFHTGCLRQLRENLANTTAEKTLLGMPEKAIQRPGFEIVVQQGEEYEAAKLGDLLSCYGPDAIHGKTKAPSAPGADPEWEEVPLSEGLDSGKIFLFQPEFDITEPVQTAHGLDRYVDDYGLTFAELRPDIVRIHPSGAFENMVDEVGNVMRIPRGDARFQLRVIDVKLSAEPSHRSFAEVAYYMMALAGWLKARGMDDRYVVVEDGAVWPGSHNAAAVRKLMAEYRDMGTRPTEEQLDEALDEDLEPASFQVLAQRLSTFFRRDLLAVLSADPDWTNLPWHVNQKCGGCEYLGRDVDPSKNHDYYCHAEAARTDSLTRVPFLSQGSKKVLHEQAVTTTAVLAGHSGASTVYDGHNALRADRHIIASRANALAAGAAVTPRGRRTAALPEWADLRIFLTVDFDPGSAITYAFGVKTFRLERQPDGTWKPRGNEIPLVVLDRDIDAEREQLVNALSAIQVGLVDAMGAVPNATAQVFVWDEVQARHMKRVMERHLESPEIQNRFMDLVWLFPPESVMRNPEVEKQSPVTVIKPALRQLAGLPIEYDYTLLESARVYHGPTAAPGMFHVHRLFEAPLNDQIPFERAHEIWTRQGHRPGKPGFIPPNTLVEHMNKTIVVRLRAMSSIAERLVRELSGQDRIVLKAKRLRGGRPTRYQGVSNDGRLWLSYAKLQSVCDRLKSAAVQTMDLDEREARFHCAVLARRFDGPDRDDALRVMGIPPDPDVWVFELAPGSTETKIRQKDFLVAVSPSGIPGFLDMTLVDLVGGKGNEATATAIAPGAEYFPFRASARAAVMELDRERRLIAVKPDNPNLLRQIETRGYCNFSADAVLDPVHKDYWTGKLEHCLRAIGNPPLAQTAPATARALR